MRAPVTALAAALLISGTATAATHNPGAPGGVRVETPTGVDYLRQYSGQQAQVTFTGPVRIERHGPNTTVRMAFNGLPGQWVVINVQPAPTPGTETPLTAPAPTSQVFYCYDGARKFRCWCDEWFRWPLCHRWHW